CTRHTHPRVGGLGVASRTHPPSSAPTRTCVHLHRCVPMCVAACRQRCCNGDETTAKRVCYWGASGGNTSRSASSTRGTRSGLRSRMARISASSCSFVRSGWQWTGRGCSLTGLLHVDGLSTLRHNVGNNVTRQHAGDALGKVRATCQHSAHLVQQFGRV